MTSSFVGSILIGGVIVWSIYRRMRRTIGRQKLRPVRILFSLVIFSLVSLLFIAIALKLQQMPLLAGIGGGLLLGGGLGFVGLHLTRFETTEEGHFYTPNTRIGIALSILFVGRMLYNMWLRQGAGPVSGPPQAGLTPLTFLTFGLLSGYYLVYYLGLFVHTHDKKTTAPPAV